MNRVTTSMSYDNVIGMHNRRTFLCKLNITNGQTTILDLSLSTLKIISWTEACKYCIVISNELCVVIIKPIKLLKTATTLMKTFRQTPMHNRVFLTPNKYKGF